MADPATPAGGAIRSAGGAFKRVPKWAWIASAGVAGGIIFMKRTKKGSQVDSSTPQDATAPADYGQTGQAFSAGYVDVPYSSSSDNGGGGNNVDVPALIGALQGFIPEAPPPVQIPDVLQALAPFVGGGAPQNSATTVAPAPAPAAPTAPAPPVAVKPCPSKYPFRSPRGCYQVVCSDGKGSRSKGRWHVYDPAANVPDQKVSDKC